MSYPTERIRVCDDCRLIVGGYAEEGDYDPEEVEHVLNQLPGVWSDIGHEYSDEEYHPDGGECDLCDWASSPNWECPGCGVTGVMFNDMHLIEKFL